MVFVRASIHNLHKASVILRHTQHVVFGSCPKDVGSDFLFLHVFFFYLEVVRARHNFVFNRRRAVNGLANQGRARRLSGYSTAVRRAEM